MKHEMRLIAVGEHRERVLAYCVCGAVGKSGGYAESTEDAIKLERWFWDHATADTFDIKPQMEVPFP